MEKLVNFVKSHPVLTALVAVGVLLLFFWPSGAAQSSGGTTDSAAAANAVAASQNANAQLQLSADQVRAIGLQAASAEAINANDNAAAVSIATIEAQANKDTLAAALATTQATTQAALDKAKVDQKTTLFGTLASALQVTQAQSAGKGTDAAGFGLMEMFTNLLNADKGVAAVNSLVTTDKDGRVIATTFQGGQNIGTVSQAVSKGQSWVTTVGGGSVTTYGNDGRSAQTSTATK